MQDRKEFVHSSCELQPGLGFLDLFPKLGNDSMWLLAPLSGLMVLPSDSSFFLERRHMFAVEESSKTASCQQNLGVFPRSLSILHSLSLPG